MTSVMVREVLSDSVPHELVATPMASTSPHRWISPVVTPGFDFTEAVVSWNTATPAGTWVEISAIVTTDDGTVSSDYRLGRWAMGDDAITRNTSADAVC